MSLEPNTTYNNVVLKNATMHAIMLGSVIDGEVYIMTTFQDSFKILDGQLHEGFLFY